MKRVYCSQYDFNCCASCHNEDEFYKTPYLGYEINHCCSTANDIKHDIKIHYEEPLESNCE